MLTPPPPKDLLQKKSWFGVDVDSESEGDDDEDEDEEEGDEEEEEEGGEEEGEEEEARQGMTSPVRILEPISGIGKNDQQTKKNSAGPKQQSNSGAVCREFQAKLNVILAVVVREDL